MSQLGYVHKILSTFPTASPAKVARTPHILAQATAQPNLLLNEADKLLYMQITGSLLYLAIGTRPDILQSVHLLTRHMQNPDKTHMKQAERIIHYLRMYPDRPLVFNGDSNSEIVCYADSAFNRGEKNQFGYCFRLGRNSGCFLSVLKKSTLVSLSSTEAEYYSLCEAAENFYGSRVFLRKLTMTPRSRPTLSVKITLVVCLLPTNSNRPTA